jgi:hypothetical protein
MQTSSAPVSFLTSSPRDSMIRNGGVGRVREPGSRVLWRDTTEAFDLIAGATANDSASKFLTVASSSGKTFLRSRRCIIRFVAVIAR